MWPSRVDVPPDLALEIGRLVDALVADLDRPHPQRMMAARTGALPLFIDWFDAFALTPDGHVIVYDAESGNEPSARRPTHRETMMMLVKGSRTHPVLVPLVPRRPPDARDCDGPCRGMGMLPEPYSHVFCTCGGVGWIPRGGVE